GRAARLPLHGQCRARQAAAAERRRCRAAAEESRDRGLPRRQIMTANTTGPVLWEVDARGVATVTLNRPEVNNAYNGDLIDGVLEALDALGNHAGLRAVLLKGNGKHFQAGADLKWVNAVRVSAREENLHASRATAQAVQRLNFAPVPTIALVQ